MLQWKTVEFSSFGDHFMCDKSELGVICMQNVCINVTLITKKHVKNYQNKLFFVPNLGVKPTKNRNVRS